MWQILHEHPHTVVCKGGRGSTKSSFVGISVVILLLQHPQCHAVVLRKIANTLRNSVYAQIQWAIGALGLQDMFRCTVSPMEITYPVSYTHLRQTTRFFNPDNVCGAAAQEGRRSRS